MCIDVTALDDVSGLMFVLRTRAFDDKVNVRRAALQLLEQVVIINRAVGQEEVGEMHICVTVCVQCTVGSMSNQ